MPVTKDKASQLQNGPIDGRKLRTVRGPKGESTRVAWSGGLSPEELARPGGVLLSMLIYRANELGHQLGDMARELNVTYGYISQLRSGLRKTEHISDQFANACASYLGTPRMTVLLASGRVKPEDVYSDPSEMFALLPAAIQLIKADPKWGPLMPPDVVTADESLKYFIVSLYEKATGRSIIIDGNGEPLLKANPADIAKQIQQFQAIRSTLAAQVEVDRLRKAGTEEAEE